tara:strand:- start:46 stop:357 length:312 start_codon:yes stop_codon:yes gene_type:complete
MDININIERLVDWYYSDPKEIEELGYQVKSGIMSGGTLSISWESCWDSMGYIPTSIIRKDSIDKHNINMGCTDLDEWEYFNKIKSFVFFDSNGNEVGRKQFNN